MRRFLSHHDQLLELSLRYETPRRKVRPGFTLIELVIVVLIIGIMTAVAAPRYVDSISHFRAESMAKRLSADLQMARRTAKTLRADKVVDFDVAGNSYELVGINDLEHTTLNYIVGLAKTGYAATLVSASFDGNDYVSFDMFGQPFTGSPLAPLVAGSIVIQSAGQTRTIVVDPTTGDASVQ